MEGGRAFVYHLKEYLGRTDAEYAFKVMKAPYRDASLVDICATLDSLKARRGLMVCERLCLSPARAAETLQDFPGLAYSILMPWVKGSTWYDVLSHARQGASGLGQDRARSLALQLASILSGLEADGMAHCDLSAGNILTDTTALTVELIDVEDFFIPGARPPVAIPAGTAGYQHRVSDQGQWNACADRFAAAILLSEMLGWYDDRVRAECYGETFFDPLELQEPSSLRYPILREAVRRQSSAAADLLDEAWRSPRLEDCPPLARWLAACRGFDFKPLIAKGPPAQPKVTWKQPLSAAKPQGAAGPVAGWKGGLSGGSGKQDPNV